jgi:hypothetical protein
MKKYELLKSDTISHLGKTLYRIKYLIDIPRHDIKAGDLGGFLESENNLSHEDDCVVFDNARVYGNALVFDSAEVYDNARVYGDAKVLGNAKVNSGEYKGGTLS